MKNSNPILNSQIFKRLTPGEKHELYRHLEEDDDLVILQAQEKYGKKEQKLVSIADTMDDAKKLIAEDGRLSGIATGYASLDGMLMGLRPGDIDVFFGATGHGKSLLVQNITLNVASKGTPVLFIGTELVNAENTERFILMQDGDLESVTNLPIAYPAEIPGYKDVDGIVEQAVEMGCQMVVIDHLHMFSTDGENEASGITKIVLELKNTAIRRGVPILLVSHISARKGQSGAPKLEDLKGSTSIGQIATHAIAIWRDETEETLQNFKLKSCKNRRPIKRRSGTLTILENARLAEEMNLFPTR